MAATAGQSLLQARALPVGVELPDGGVLVAGGSSNGWELAACDRYDSATATWTPAAPLSIPREYHALVSLADGRILAAGGISHAGTVGSEPRDSAEVYDPAADKWTPVGNMSARRHQAGATRLADGRVLVAGGYGPGGATLQSAELFDPATGAWSAAAATLGAVRRLLALPDGRVLAIGWGAPVQRYDPATDTWESMGPLPHPGVEALVLLADGRVVFLGDDGTAGRAWLWSPASGFTPTAPIPGVRSDVRAIRLADGSVLVVGGRSASSPSVLASVVRYHPSGGTWTAEEPLLEARTTPALHLLQGGAVLVAGGRSDVGGWRSLASVELVAPSCSPTTCAAAGAECGPIPDGCGGSLECGACGAGLTCAAGACSDATAPQVSIVSPPTHSIVGATVEVRVEASDAVGVVLVELYAGTLKVGSATGAGPHTFLWDASAFAYGPWTLEARALDSAGNVARSAPIEVTLQNPFATYDATLKAPRCPVAADCRSGQLLQGRGPVGPEPNAPNTLLSQCADGSSGSYHSDESLDTLRIRTVDGTVLAPGKVVEVEAVVWAWSATSDLLELFSAADAKAPAWTWVATLHPTTAGLNTLRTTFTLPSGGLQAIRGSFSYGAATSPATPCRAGVYNDADDLVFGVQLAPDVSPPATAFAAPLEGATLTGPTAVTVNATDDTSVAGVELLLDGAVVATWHAAPFTTTWDPATTSPGPHTLVARAWDPAGNVGTASRIIQVVRDTTAPTVTVSVPASGATVSGVILIRATAADDHGVTAVDFYANGTWLGTSYQMPAASYWNTASFANGAATVEVRARDAAGNVGSASVPVTIFNDTTPPTVALTAPAPGATVSGTASLQASATDAQSGVARVEFLVDGALVGTSTAAPYAVSWTTSAVADGMHAVTARAVDGVGNAATSAAVSIQVANAPGFATYDAVLGAPRCAAPQASCDTGSLVNGRGAVGPEQNRPNTLGGTCADGSSGSYHQDESLDRLRVSTLDGLPFAAGKTVRIEATVWVWGASGDYLDLYAARDALNPQWTLVATLRPTTNGSQKLSTTYVLPAGQTQAIRGVFRYGGTASPCGTGPFDDRDDLVIAVQ